MKKEFNILKIKITKEQFVNLIKVLAKIGLILLIFISMLLLSHSVLLSPDDYNLVKTLAQTNDVKKGFS